MATAVDCDPNENNATCARDISCQPTCDNFQGTGCPHACDPTVCVCNDGFIRASSDNQTCIEKTQCTPSKKIGTHFVFLISKLIRI